MDVSSGAAVASLLLDDHDDDSRTSSTSHRSNCTRKIRNNGKCEIKSCTNNQTMDNKNGNSEKDSVTPTFRVLDLCCAPGLKTCAIADLLSTSINTTTLNQHFSIVGVDISKRRIDLCKSIVKKYHVDPETYGDFKNKKLSTSTSKNEPYNHSSLINNTLVQKKPISEQFLSKRSSHDLTDKISTVGANRHIGNCASGNIRLYCTDGTIFGTEPIDPKCLVFDSDISRLEYKLAGKRKRMNKSARAREKKMLRKIQVSLRLTEEEKSGDVASLHSINPSYMPLFDRVLVDAECSTDGAVRHLEHKYKRKNVQSKAGVQLQKTNNKGIDSATATTLMSNTAEHALEENTKSTNPQQIADLVAQQKKLIASGFRLLKPGGIMVYSTCSLVKKQNEDVVSWLINIYSEGKAFVIPVAFPSGRSSVGENQNNDTMKEMISNGFLDGTVRFRPSTGTDTVSEMHGGGFFLAKIGRTS